MRVIDLRHSERERIIGTWEHEGVLIDPGPERTVDTLLEGLGSGFEPSAILLTHIHFDHAGATGRLLERWPGTPVYVHERGVRHLADPTRLLASARQVFGEAFDRLWGEVLPVPEENLRGLAGGETVAGAYEVAYTPGHASHHVSYLHTPTGTAFVGDVAGIRIPDAEIVLMPTPPPDIDIALWERSLDTIAAWQPAQLVLTHFGVGLPVPEHLEAARAALYHERDMVRDLDREVFVAAFTAEMVERADAATANAYNSAVEYGQIWDGLARWWSKQ